MNTTSLIGHTIELFDLLRTDARPADVVIEKFFRARKYLGSHDRGFIAETVYSMVRHQLRLETLLEYCLYDEISYPPPKPYPALLFYLALAIGIEGQPHKEVAATLQPLWKEFYYLNPITFAYRIFLHKELDFLPPHPIHSLAVRYSFPDWMIEHWLSEFGVEETALLCDALNQPAPITLRVNTLKISVEECQQQLQEQGIACERTKFSPFGLTISQRRNIYATKPFRDGFIEMQDEGSQLISLLLDPKPTAKVVDACAGAGGKTLTLAALMKNRGEVFAFDVHDHRLRQLQIRARRADVQNIRIRLVPEQPTEQIADLVGKADAVLIDAPCSGLGVLRRNPDAKWKITPQTIVETTQKQRTILQHYASLVKPGGRLVYATCTTLRAENENIVEEFLQTHSEFSLVKPQNILDRWGLSALASDNYLKLYPHRHGTDGFFAAVTKRL
jgi:16S rRNA (cytosine967-C5)-methyltransferase